jgi:hypothetical protein
MPLPRKLPARLETDPKKMVELLVGLPEVTVLGVFTEGVDVELHIETRRAEVGCPICGTAAEAKGWREVVLVDLQVFGKPTRLHWHKRRWRCPGRTVGDRSGRSPGPHSQRGGDHLGL